MFKKLRAFLRSTEVNPDRLEIDKLTAANKLLSDSLQAIQDVCYNPRQSNLISLSRIGKITREALDND